jgi:hypothetical protein
MSTVCNCDGADPKGEESLKAVKDIRSRRNLPPTTLFSGLKKTI